MEDNLNFLENGRRPQILNKCRQPNFLENGRQLHNLANKRRPQYLNKWKTTSIFSKMEDDLDIFPNGISHK